MCRAATTTRAARRSSERRRSRPLRPASGRKGSAPICSRVRAPTPPRRAPPGPALPSRPRLTGASAPAGCGYCVCPCGCGAPEAVRNVGNHLARHGGTATCNMFPCVWKRWFDFKGDLTCEVAASGTCCYVCCPCVYVPSNRELFVSRHKLEGGCCEDCASHQLLARVSSELTRAVPVRAGCIGCCLWGCALRQMEAHAELIKQQTLRNATSAVGRPGTRSVAVDMER